MFLQKSPKYLLTDWSTFVSITSVYKQLRLILGDFWIHLGYLLFHHLITLYLVSLYPKATL